MNYGVLGAVAAGGAIGSVARYLLDGFIQSLTRSPFPFGIFVVNITGGLIIGVLTEMMALKWNVSQEMRSFLVTGILGGYTTFSTFSLQSALLIERQAYGQAAVYVTGSVVLSIVGFFAGTWLIRLVYA